MVGAFQLNIGVGLARRFELLEVFFSVLNRDPLVDVAVDQQDGHVATTSSRGEILSSHAQLFNFS